MMDSERRWRDGYEGECVGRTWRAKEDTLDSSTSFLHVIVLSLDLDRPSLEWNTGRNFDVH